MVKTDFSMADVNGFTISKEELDRAFDERFPVWIKEKLQNASVAIAGLGGLGSNIAVSLARSGVGHLFLVTASRSVRFDSRPDQCYYIYTPLGV